VTFVGRSEQRSGGRYHQCRAQTLDDRFAQDHKPDRVRNRRHKRTDGKNDCAQHKHLFAAKDIAKPPPSDSERRKHQCVCCNDPLNTLNISVEITDDRAQCDIQDCCVEDNDRQSQAQNQQRYPFKQLVH